MREISLEGCDLRRHVECVGCGARVPVGASRRTVNVMSVSPVLYRRGSGKGGVKCGRRSNVCEACLAAFITGSIDSRFMNIVVAMRESLSGLYNAILAERG